MTQNYQERYTDQICKLQTGKTLLLFMTACVMHLIHITLSCMLQVSIQKITGRYIH